MKATPDGTVLVPVSNRLGAFAEVDASDWMRWRKSGLSTVWFLASNGSGQHTLRYGLSGSRRLGTVARTIAGASPDELVCPIDGNPLRLVRSNLVTKSKTGPRAGQQKRFADLGTAGWRAWVKDIDEGLPHEVLGATA